MRAQLTIKLVGDRQGYVSVAALITCAVTLREDQSKMILEFFENPYINVRPVTRQIAEMAHEFTRTHSLRNADAIHVATAVISKAEVLHTWDDKKQRRSGLLRHNLKIGNPPLRIEVPPDPDKGTLFADKPENVESSPAEPQKPEKPPDSSATQS